MWQKSLVNKMKILVLNGSPKGKYSITLQHTRYLEKLYPAHQFEVLNVGQKIKSLEKDFSPAAEAIEKADVLLFSYPVYTFIAPCQLHKFIELLKAAKLDLSSKYATQITTSKHFYDVTAHRYIQDNCADLGLKYIKGLSADMDDLLTEKGQKEARDFFDFLCWSMENGYCEPASAVPTTYSDNPIFVPADAKKKDGDVVVLTDAQPQSQLSYMIDCFEGYMPRKIRVINLRDYPFNGGCLGCFGCAITGKCVHKDGFDDYLRKEIQTAEAIVYAFTIKDHSMGPLFKMYDDRNFCNGHRTVTVGMPVGYLVCGDLSKEENLRTIMEARAQVGSNFLAGIATDEFDPNNTVMQLAKTLEYALEHKYVPPQNFYGIGGMKIFRDLIWLMQGMMRADHKFYKSHGQYDFPQKKWPMMLKMYLVGSLLANEKLKSKMGNMMNEGMLMPYNKLLESMDKQ